MPDRLGFLTIITILHPIASANKGLTNAEQMPPNPPREALGIMHPLSKTSSLLASGRRRST